MITKHSESVHLHIVEGHEHSKGAQVVAGAHGEFRVGLHRRAAVGRPAPVPMGSLPEHTQVETPVSLEENNTDKCPVCVSYLIS